MGKATVTLHTDDIDYANLVYRRGLVWEYRSFMCDGQQGWCGAVLGCHDYGHTLPVCKSTPRCGWCSSTTHSDDQCEMKHVDLGAWH